MAVSSSSDFIATRNQIIRAAALKIGAIGAGVEMPDRMLQDFAFALNAMVKRWDAKGLHVWTVEEATLFVQPEQTRYQLGNSSTDHATDANDYAETALSADAASGATTITVDSITGIANGDNVGVVVDDGTLHWTTVNGAPSGSTVTLTTGLDDSASEDAKVFAYTTKIAKPLRVVAARRKVISSGLENEISPVARLDYRRLPDKTQAGVINQFFYDPRRLEGFLYLWMVPSTVTELVNFTWHRQIYDFDAASDNPDLPSEWVDAIVYGLAVTMAPEFDVPDNKFAQVKMLADQFLDELSGHDREAESIFFQPDLG